MTPRESDDKRATMPASRLRRIVRRATVAVAASVLLLTLYVGNFVIFAYASGAGKVPPRLEPFIGVAYLPLGFYMEFGLPGSQTLFETFHWALEEGKITAEN